MGGGAVRGRWWEELVASWCQGVLAVADLVTRRVER